MSHGIKPIQLVLAIALLRVSSDRQYQEGHGIENQRSRVDFFADRNGISIVSYFIEHYSGRKSDRTVIDDMEAFIRAQNGAITQLIISDIDRFTRAGSDIYLQLKKRFAALGVELVDASGVIQKPINTLEHLGVEYEWSVRSPSHSTEVMLADNANANATRILTNCIGGQIEVARSGYQYQSAHYGYRNEKQTINGSKKVSIMVSVKEEAQYVTMMFELRAEGLLSDEEICEKLNTAGYRSRIYNRYHAVTREIIGQGGNKPLTVKKLQRVIANPVYCGFQYGKWTGHELLAFPYKQALVSINLFNRANRGKVVIEKRDNQYQIIFNRIEYDRYSNHNDFLFRHVVFCSQCNNPFVASKPRSKSGKYFGYYHCSRKHKYIGINKDEFESTVAKYVGKITYKKKFFGLLKEVARDVWMQKNQSKQRLENTIQDHIKELQQRQENLLRRIETCTSTTVQQKLEQEYEELEDTISKAEYEQQDSNITERDIESYFQYLKLVMEHPNQYLLDPDSKEEIKKTWGFVFHKSPTYQEIKNGTPRLSLVFKLSRDSSGSKRQLVHQLSSQWNTFSSHIKAFHRNHGD